MTLPTPEPARPQPGKTRTWWHPLLVNVLRWQLGEHYRVEEEVNVGKKPLQIDVLLLRQQLGELPESVRRTLGALAEYLNELTLLEFKSPSDTLRAGDFQTFLTYALLYRAQNDPLLLPSRLNLVVIAPRLTAPYRKELKVCGVATEQPEPGVWRLHGGAALYTTWLLETEVLANRGHPLLAIFSPQVLHDPQAISQQLRREGHEQLVVYVTQQVKQFRNQGEGFTMQHLGADEEMNKVWGGLLSTLQPEERLAGLTPEQIVEGLKLEGLTPEQREQLLALLRQGQEKTRKPKRGKKGGA